MPVAIVAKKVTWQKSVKSRATQKPSPAVTAMKLATSAASVPSHVTIPESNVLTVTRVCRHTLT